MSNLFLKACRREPVERTPVWFMRQAGRYMAEYRAIRAKHTLLELCKRPDLAAEITLQPVERLGVDAAILFADLLLTAEAMGMRVEFVAGEGPVIHDPVRSAAGVDKLRGVECAADLEYVSDALRKVRAALKPEVALLGFAGAPFTLASYMIEGGPSRDYAATKAMMIADTPLWTRLMEKIVAVQTQYLKDQIAAGAQAVQIFDSWAGCLSPHDYATYVLPHTRALIANVAAPSSRVAAFDSQAPSGVAALDSQAAQAPIIHFATGIAGFLHLLPQLGANVISLDWRVDLGTAWHALGDVPVQGNLDPIALLLPLPELRNEVRRVMDQARGRRGHIFNVGHGILQQTPVDNVRAVVELVRELS